MFFPSQYSLRWQFFQDNFMQHWLKLRLMVLFLLFLHVAQATAVTCNSTMNESVPSADFTLNSIGTVLHSKTGLTWARCAIGQTWDNANSTCTGTATRYLWSEALTQAVSANNGNYLGQNDWRVPNIKELTSILERGCFAPAINSTVFPAMPTLLAEATEWFWSASLYASDQSKAWGVGFALGNANTGPIKPTTTPSGSWDAKGWVRLVRGGQPLDAFDALPSPITLVASPSTTTTLGNNVTLAANLAGGGSYTGTLTFKNNGVAITGCETKAINSNAASCTLTNPALGNYVFSAVFSGDNTHVASTSANLNFNVTQGSEVRNSITGLYITYFNRAPDKSGLAYWEAQALANGDSKALYDISAAFALNSAAITNYPSSMSNSQFVTQVYNYALSRPTPDAAGKTYWEGRLAVGVSRSNMMVEYINAVLYYNAATDTTSTATEKQAALDAQTMIQNKVAAGIFFATNVLGANDKSNVPVDASGHPITTSAQYAASQDIMVDVTKDVATLDAAYTKSKNYKISLP
jgi:hypothetical protein